MSKKLFVGNISWEASSEDLEELFSQYGAVNEAIIINDKLTGRSRGFGFVDFENEEDATKAMEALNEHEFKGRKIIVDKAKPSQK